MKGKVPNGKDIRKTILGILQSTAFLAWSGFSYSLFICLLRKVLGRFHILTVSYIPSFLSSLTAILIERPSRRPLLCLYVSNIATETLFKMGLWREYYSPIPQGGTYVFALSIGLLLYFFRSKPNNDDTIYKIIRLIVGKYEQNEYFDQYGELTDKSQPSGSKIREFPEKHDKSDKKLQVNILLKSLDVYKRIIKTIKTMGKHVSCPHPHSCLHYVLKGGGTAFIYGMGVQMALKLVFQLRKLYAKPHLIKSTVLKKENLNLAVFLGGFASLYRLVSCSLRRVFEKDSHSYGVPAGLIASIAFMAYPDNTIALYFMWKALQLFWNHLVEKKTVPEVKWFVIFLYCVSTALLFHVAIMEPQNLRPSYWKFLYNISGGRIAAMPRLALDEFGLETSKHLQEVLRKTNTTDKHTYSF